MGGVVMCQPGVDWPIEAEAIRKLTEGLLKF